VEYRKVHLEKKNVMVWGTRICLSFDLHQYRFEHSLQTLLVTLTALPLTMTHISFISGVPLHGKVYYYHVSVPKVLATSKTEFTNQVIGK